MTCLHSFPSFGRRCCTKFWCQVKQKSMAERREKEATTICWHLTTFDSWQENFCINPKCFLQTHLPGTTSSSEWGRWGAGATWGCLFRTGLVDGKAKHYRSKSWHKQFLTDAIMTHASKHLRQHGVSVYSQPPGNSEHRVGLQRIKLPSCSWARVCFCASLGCAHLTLKQKWPILPTPAFENTQLSLSSMSSLWRKNRSRILLGTDGTRSQILWTWWKTSVVRCIQGKVWGQLVANCYYLLQLVVNGRCQVFFWTLAAAAESCVWQQRCCILSKRSLALKPCRASMTSKQPSRQSMRRHTCLFFWEKTAKILEMT